MKYFQPQLLEDIRLKSILAIAFFIPISQKLSTICIFFSVFFSLIDYKNVFKRGFKLSPYLPLVLLFLLYAVAFYRDNYELSIKMFEQKASLIAFPLIFFSLKLNKPNLIKVLKTFVYGCFTSYIILLVIAFYNSIDFSTFNFTPILKDYVGKEYDYFQVHYFLGKLFANNFHGTYLSIYFLFSIIIINLFNNEFSIKIKYIFYLCFGAFIFQIFSISSLFILLIIILYFGKKYIKIGILTVLTIGIIFSSFNFTKVIDNFKAQNRPIIWETAISVLKEKPLFGFGIKTAQKKLHDNYPKSGEFGALTQKKKTDSHNLFLQISIEMGFIGLFLLIMAYSKIIFIKIKDYELKTTCISFILLFALLSIIESTFNVYLGISYFCFFYCLFVNFDFTSRNINAN